MKIKLKTLDSLFKCETCISAKLTSFNKSVNQIFNRDMKLVRYIMFLQYLRLKYLANVLTEQTISSTIKHSIRRYHMWSNTKLARIHILSLRCKPYILVVCICHYLPSNVSCIECSASIIAIEYVLCFVDYESEKSYWMCLANNQYSVWFSLFMLRTNQ